jgi:hypothetical protein
MMQLTRIFGGLAVAALLVGVQVVTVLSDQAPPVNVPGIDKPVIVVTSEITGTETDDRQPRVRGAVLLRWAAR